MKSSAKLIFYIPNYDTSNWERLTSKCYKTQTVHETHVYANDGVFRIIAPNTKNEFICRDNPYSRIQIHGLETKMNVMLSYEKEQVETSRVSFPLKTLNVRKEHYYFSKQTCLCVEYECFGDDDKYEFRDLYIIHTLPIQDDNFDETYRMLESGDKETYKLFFRRFDIIKLTNKICEFLT